MKQLSKRTILVTERQYYGIKRAGESIPAETQSLFKQLNFWQEFLNDGHDPCLGSCSAWGNAELDCNGYLFNPMGHGWHLKALLAIAFLQKKQTKNCNQKTQSQKLRPLNKNITT